jgi:hypothetical protein
MSAYRLSLVGIGVLAAAASAAGPVALSKSVDVQSFKTRARVEVRNVTLGFWPNGPVLGDPRKKSRQFVRVEIAVTNTGASPYSLRYTSYELRTAEEPRVTQTPSINKGNSTDRLGSKPLAPGESASGALYFEIGGQETLATLALLTEGYVSGKGEVQYAIPFGAEPATAAAKPQAAAPASARAGASRPAPAAAAPAAPRPQPPASATGAAPGPIALETVSRPDMGYQISVPKGAKVLGQSSLQHTYSLVLPDRVNEINVNVAKVGEDSLDAAVRTVQMAGVDKILEKSDRGGGEYDIVAAWGPGTQQVHAYRRKGPVKVRAKCAGPAAQQSLLKEICGSLAIVK